MEALTKREREILAVVVTHEATRLETLSSVVELPQHKRTVREKKNEFLEILRKLLGEDDNE